MSNSTFSQIQSKIKNWEDAKVWVEACRSRGESIVFTNGCFDLLHYGHLQYLAAASELADHLILGLNSKDSITRLKGPTRPINDDLTRTHLLAGLQMIKLVVIFEQDTPMELIQLLSPDILVKGGDWHPSQIVGSELVLSQGGKVLSLPFAEGYSSTNIVEKIKKTAKE